MAKRRKATPKKVAEAQPAPEREPGQETVADEIERICGEFAELTLEVRQIEEQQKERNKRLAKMSGRLVELLEMSNLKPPFYPTSGGRISIKNDLSVKQEDKDLLCHSLAELGMEDLIQPTIHTGSLKSAIKKRLEEHQPLPVGISIKPYSKAVFTA